ncbi:MAG: UbiH/UbiF family hydroxylase [Burkholderia sp.]
MTTYPQICDVAVVGGGLVGKTAALAITQVGLKAALLAPPAAPSATDTAFDVRVYALSASSQALLERLRVWQALEHTRVTPVYDMRVYGDAQAELHFSAFQAAVPQLAWIGEASLIERALDAALRFQPNLSWIDTRAQGLDITPEHATLSLANGEVLSVDLVVGADGANSWMHSQIGTSVQRRDYRQTGVVANFKAAEPHRETAWQWFFDGEIAALLPLPEGHVSLVWSAYTAHADALLALNPAQLAAEVERVTHRQLGALDCVTPAQGFPLALQTVDRLITPRVALVGDAAHLIHPLAGQGVNLGLRDVATLVDTVASREAFRDLGDTVLLRRYERSRRADIYAMMVATHGLQWLFALPGTLACVARNTGMALVGAQPFVKRWLVASALR